MGFEFLVGIVNFLPKTDHPGRGFDFRPITVFNILYRVWSRCWAHQILQWLSKWVHPGVFGFLPFRNVLEPSLVTALFLENRKTWEGPAYGYVLDVTKCFNCMHWFPFLSLLQHAGLPPSFIQTWHTNLKSMTRIIRVDDYLGDSISSTVGFPEGDP